MTSSNYIQYITKSGLCRKTLTAFCLFSMLLWSSSTAIAITTADEEVLDREAGILDRPWRINLVRLATRDYLRYKAQVKTGLPSYDQLVEGSRQAPQVLFDRLTATPEPSPTKPDPEPRRTSPAPAPLTTPAPAPASAPASEPVPAPAAPAPPPPPAPPTGFNPDPPQPFVPPWSSPPTS